MGNFKEDIARCEAFVFDVDGVMTDGGIIPTPDGDFIRRYNAKDGYALAYAIKIGYKVCIITSRVCKRQQVAHRSGEAKNGRRLTSGFHAFRQGIK